MTEHKEENVYATYRNKTQEHAHLLEISHQITSYFMIKSVTITPCPVPKQLFNCYYFRQQKHISSWIRLQLSTKWIIENIFIFSVPIPTYVHTERHRWLTLTSPIVAEIIRNKDLRVIYVFTTDPYASFHVNYGNFASFRSQILLGNESSEFLPCLGSMFGENRTCFK